MPVINGLEGGVPVSSSLFCGIGFVATFCIEFFMLALDRTVEETGESGFLDNGDWILTPFFALCEVFFAKWPKTLEAPFPA